MKTQSQIAGVVGTVMGVTLLAGCSGPRIQLHRPDLTDSPRPIRLHVLGVTDDEWKGLKRQPQSYWAYAYWNECNGPTYEHLVEGGRRYEGCMQDEIAIHAKEDLWKRWKAAGVVRLLVIADMPLVNGQGYQTAPFDPGQWDKKTLRITVDRQSGLSVDRSGQTK